MGLMICYGTHRRMRGRSPFAAQTFPSLSPAGRLEIIVSNVRQGSVNVLKVLMRELYCGRDVTVMLEYPGWGGGDHLMQEI
jgi:hypothetical protein